jgi:hypothetical protein
MGRFQCVQCRCTYHSKRFFWEREKNGSEFDANAATLQCKLLEPTLLVDHDISEEASTAASESPDYTDFAQELSDDSVVSSANAELLKMCETRGFQAHDSEDAEASHSSEESGSSRNGLQDYRCEDEDAYISDGSRSSRRKIAIQRLAAHADVVRATGTCANVLGTAAPALHAALAPFSVAGGAVGAVSGAVQLRRGLSTPSGIVDPHLVTKGAVTTSVGACCMALAAGAAVFPGLFLGALSLGIVGVGVATTIDAKMDGLCEQCRENGHAAADPNLSATCREKRAARRTPSCFAFIM